MRLKGSFLMMGHAAALSVLFARTVPLLEAQSSPPVASTAASSLFLMSASRAASASSSTSLDAARPNPILALANSQPPPRRTYGRRDYSHANPDGSSKYTFLVGFGVPMPIGNTHHYETPAWGLQVGAGRNFNQNVGVLFQFDYDHFGLQASTIANQQTVENTLYPCTAIYQQAGLCAPISNLDGTNHVWSFTFDPVFSLATGHTLGAYTVVGGGFYHKVTTFTVPASQEECGTYGCGYYTVNQTIDHYTSNAGGVNGGLGVTARFSQFSSARLYLEARYVFIANQPRTGYTAQNVSTTTYTGYNAYPANSHRTTYIPIKLGIRF